MNRNFNPGAPNQVWASNISFIQTWEGWLYLAIVIDLFSHRVIGQLIAGHMRTGLTLKALMMAIGERHPQEGLICHSDRGSQYASEAYQQVLETHGIMKCSMGRKGVCWDNTVA